MEAAHKLTLVNSLPMLKNINQSLKVLSSGIFSGVYMHPLLELIKLLSTVTLNAINDIKIHVFWFAACVFHPGFFSLSFMARRGGSDAKISGESLMLRITSEDQSYSVSQSKHILCPIICFITRTKW